jgi:dinuclear metal center YbgI/SA1388 family protein
MEKSNLSTIRAVTAYLEQIAPPVYQESYDNSGLIVGDPQAIVTGIVISLDATEAVVDDAIARGANLIVAHHPIVFKGLKKFNGRNYVERTVMKAIKHDIAIYAIHTNLDNMLYNGVNTRFAEMLGLQNCHILVPKRQTLNHLVTYVPLAQKQQVLDALFAAGAGQIGDYKNCSFTLEGTGTFQPTGNANPTIGTLNELESVHEARIEVLIPSHLSNSVLRALRQAHPYEEVAYYMTTIENTNQEVGSGMIGTLETAMDEMDFLKQLKSTMQCSVVRHTKLFGKPIQRIAVCGGSGSFLLQDAIAQGADVFVTADYKYHEFFDAENKIIIADIGHFESEQYTISLIFDVLSKKYRNFALYCTTVNTNPVHYI